MSLVKETLSEFRMTGIDWWITTPFWNTRIEQEIARRCHTAPIHSHRRNHYSLKMMLTPTPFHLGAIIMGVNPCAVDAVGCHMVHVDPRDVVHLNHAQRGIGPIDLDEIEVVGDYPLEEVQSKTSSFQLCMEHVDDYFEKSRIFLARWEASRKSILRITVGGCPGALQGAIISLERSTPILKKKSERPRYGIRQRGSCLNLKRMAKNIAGDCCSGKAT